MRKLGADIPEAIRAMGGDSREARINLRAHQVRERYKQALESVCGETAPFFLAHTNNVYILRKDGVMTLIVYVDESIYAAELNARRELIRLRLLELFGEAVEDFQIHISRGDYKNNHPYLTEDAGESHGSDESLTPIPLDADEESFVSNTVSSIKDEHLRESLKNAMTADLQWKKAEKAKQPQRNTK